MCSLSAHPVHRRVIFKRLFPFSTRIYIAVRLREPIYAWQAITARYDVKWTHDTAKETYSRNVRSVVRTHQPFVQRMNVAYCYTCCMFRGPCVCVIKLYVLDMPPAKTHETTEMPFKGQTCVDLRNHAGTHWRHLTHATERGDAALCQITLTTTFCRYQRPVVDRFATIRQVGGLRVY